MGLRCADMAAGAPFGRGIAAIDCLIGAGCWSRMVAGVALARGLVYGFPASERPITRRISLISSSTGTPPGATTGRVGRRGWDRPRTGAGRGAWPVLKPFGWTDRKGLAWLGIVLAALLLWRYASGSGLTVHTYLVGLTVIAITLPYLFSACARLTRSTPGSRPWSGQRQA
jgi:hypothetical protein